MTIQTLMKKRGRISWPAALLLTILFFNVGLVISPTLDTQNMIIRYGFVVFGYISVFLLFYLKKGNRVRWTLFSLMSIFMVFWFVTYFFAERGHIGLTEADIKEGIPFCHIAIVNELLALPVLGDFVSMGRLSGHSAAIYPMILIWLWATVLLGKGWCSWGCFYGGYDNFFSRLIKKPLVKIKDSTSKKLRIFPFAYLFVIAFLSMLTFSSVFCAYLCPFKTVTEFMHVTTLRTWIIFLVAVGGFIGFCVILPIIFGKRVWCTYLCPFGAWQSIVGKVFSIFKLKIDTDACIDCKKCVRECRTAGITESSLEKRKFTSNCSLCGICIDECPKQAIKVSAFGATTTIATVLERVTRPLAKYTRVDKVRRGVIGFIDELLLPQNFLYFFALAVLFTFFGSFYYEGMNSLYKILSGGY